MIETIHKLVRATRQLVQVLGREPQPEELSESLELPLEKVRMVLRIANDPISLETPVGEDDDGRLSDFIEDPNGINPADAVIQSSLAEHTRELLATLAPREARVLRMRFGIGERANRTLEEVGQDFDVTRARFTRSIKQTAGASDRRPGGLLEARSLFKLSYPIRCVRNGARKYLRLPLWGDARSDAAHGDRRARSSMWRLWRDREK